MTAESQAAPLDDLRLKSRVLVVVAPGEDSSATEQRQIYRTSEQGMSERAIVLVEALGDGDRARQIRMRLGADGNRFQVYLIGKDGHTAFSSKAPVPADDLFAKVDAMPMRQQEMKRAR